MTPHPSVTSHFDLPGPFALESGVELSPVTVAYRTWGRLNAVRDNAVLVCHALTGSPDADAWRRDLFGPGRALDPDHDFIVCSNVLGSCYGTTGPGTPEWDAVCGAHPEDPAITVRDVVHVQRHLLDALGVRRLQLVIGGSMGGMQACSSSAPATSAGRPPPKACSASWWPMPAWRA